MRTEIRQALRALGAAPWYTAASMAVVALGMALATAAFALVDGVLFRPLPYPAADEIVAFGGAYSDVPAPPATLTRPASGHDYHTWMNALPELAITATVHYRTELPDGEYAPAVNVTENFFDVFGVTPWLGPGFSADTFERRDPRPVVISHAFWLRQFGGDPGVVGRVFRRHTQIGPNPAPGSEVVGVMAPDFVFPSQPTRPAPDIIAPHTIGETGERFLTMFARKGQLSDPDLRARLDAATTAYAAIAPPLRERPGESPAARRLREPYDAVAVYPIRDYLTSLQRPMFGALFGMATVLGLLACLSV